MDSTQRYELIRPILHPEKSVQQVHQETTIPIRTLYRYLQRFREGNGQLESLANQPHTPHSHPNWFTEEEKDQVVWYKLHHRKKSARQIATDMTQIGLLSINYHSVADILKERRLTTRFFFR